jgi:SPP1 gp7 family putative phage head morphogenesis protein
MPLTPAQIRNAARQRFNRARIVQTQYERQLAQVGRNVGHLIKGMAPEGIVRDVGAIQRILEAYSRTLQPWAGAVVERMQAEVSQRDIRAWAELGRSIGQSLKKEILHAPTGRALREAMEEQIHSITSLPLEAAERLNKLTLRGITEGTRTPEIMEAILNSGNVSISRARLIARTQVATTASKLTEVRALHIGSPGYFWRTSLDSDVRLYHRKLEGKFIEWNNPPVVDKDGRRAHAGQDYQCRCYPEVAIPD